MQILALFDKFDSHNSGSIDYSEFVENIAEKSASSKPKSANTKEKKEFNFFDNFGKNEKSRRQAKKQNPTKLKISPTNILILNGINEENAAPLMNTFSNLKNE